MSTENKKKNWEKLDKFIRDIRVEPVSVNGHKKREAGHKEHDALYHLEKALEILKKDDI